MSNTWSDESIEIREVWSHNLHREFKLINDCVDAYPYISIDTEFPGNVIQDNPNRKDKTQASYSCFVQNINSTKLIQLGLTMGDIKGNLPKCGTNKSSCIWQFNFCDFNINRDKHVKESIELLVRSGVDLKKNRAKGVRIVDFAELALSSGIFLNDDVWLIFFHGSSDFGYLLKMLRGRQVLPKSSKEFMELMSVFNPNFYDVKHLAQLCNIFGGLNSLATQMNVKRVGIAHQAGSDSLVTYRLFLNIVEKIFNGELPRIGFNVLYGVALHV